MARAGDQPPGPVAARPAGADDMPAPPNQVSRGEARPGPVLPADPVAALRPNPIWPEPPLVAAKSPGTPAPPVGVPAKTTEPVPPKPPVPTDDRTKAVEALAKRLQEALDRADDLERKNAILQAKVTTLTQAVAQGKADCDRRAADLQKTIDSLRPAAVEALKVRDELRDLRARYDALLKARPPVESVKPKVGFGPPPIDVKPPVDPVKPPVEQKKKP